jgi:hypothetical protein
MTYVGKVDELVLPRTSSITLSLTRSCYYPVGPKMSYFLYFLPPCPIYLLPRMPGRGPPPYPLAALLTLFPHLSGAGTEPTSEF